MQTSCSTHSHSQELQCFLATCAPQSDAAVGRIAVTCLFHVHHRQVCHINSQPAHHPCQMTVSSAALPHVFSLHQDVHVACRHHCLMRQSISSAGMSLKPTMERQSKARCLDGHMLHLPTQLGPGQCWDQLKSQSSKTWLKQKQVPSSAQLPCPPPCFGMN